MSAVSVESVIATRKAGMKLAKHGDDEQNRTCTRTEQKLLDALIDPETRGLTQKELCERVGCGRTTLYHIMADPWFEQQRRTLLNAQIRKQAAAFVQAAAITAATPGRDGFQDRRLLLSMSGDHVERRQHQHEVTGAVVVGVIGCSMDEL